MFIAAALLGATSPAPAARDVSLLDIVELDMGYTTITDNYYQAASPQRLLDGARTGIVAYLRGRGVADPAVPLLRARPDGRGVVPAIEQQLGKAIDRYGSRVETRELVYAAICGELAALHDPYSVFFRRAELRRFTTALDGAPFGGIGVSLALTAEGEYQADQVFDDAPAARAGLLAGDRIVAVDGKPLAGRSPAAVAALLKGRAGTTVQLDVLRAADAQTQRLSIVRAAITPPEVSARLLPGDVAYIALRGFGPAAGEQVRAALIRLRARGARATLFDLRGNGGGYETAAVRVASVFVPSGTIVVTQTNHGHQNIVVADGTAPAPQPLAVLVDRDSASGSELVTGAIADHGLGKVVGTRTFGKGLVQTMFPLPDGSAVKLTTARYFTPGGHDIDGIGLRPDLAVDEPATALRGVPGSDPQLDAALALLAQVHANSVPCSRCVSHVSIKRRAIVSK
ncbi:MAG: S41 family peptidase [Candidatus Velthaea sp.]|jgi:carboxyl-terminal processing protease